jgi:hypothetical protein
MEPRMARMGTDVATDGTDDTDGATDSRMALMTRMEPRIHGWSHGFTDGATDSRMEPRMQGGGYSSMPAKVLPWLGSPESKPFLNQYILCLEVPCVNASGTT